MNIASARSGTTRGGLFHALQAVQRVRPCPYTPQQLPAACVASYGQQAAIFAPMSGRSEHVPKRKTAVKAICRPYTAFYTIMAIPIFPHRKTAHIGRQRPAQGIKQPRPAPSGVSRGFVNIAGNKRQQQGRALSTGNLYNYTILQTGVLLACSL